MDWTDFDADKLALYLIKRQRRATPLLWLTIDKINERGRASGRSTQRESRSCHHPERSIGQRHDAFGVQAVRKQTGQ